MGAVGNSVGNYGRYSRTIRSQTVPVLGVAWGMRAPLPILACAAILLSNCDGARPIGSMDYIDSYDHVVLVLGGVQPADMTRVAQAFTAKGFTVLPDGPVPEDMKRRTILCEFRWKQDWDDALTTCSVIDSASGSVLGRDTHHYHSRQGDSHDLAEAYSSQATEWILAQYSGYSPTLNAARPAAPPPSGTK